MEKKPVVCVGPKCIQTSIRCVRGRATRRPAYLTRRSTRRRRCSSRPANCSCALQIELIVIFFVIEFQKS